MGLVRKLLQRIWIRTTWNRTCNGCYSQRNDLHSCQGPYGLPKLRGPPTCLNASERRIAPLILSPSNWSPKFVSLTTLTVHLTDNPSVSKQMGIHLKRLSFEGEIINSTRPTTILRHPHLSVARYTCILCGRDVFFQLLLVCCMRRRSTRIGGFAIMDESISRQ